MRLALFQPDIPQNTGTILRLASCLGLPVDVIGPAGFDLSQKAVRRAGLDYLEHVDLTVHLSWAAFVAARASNNSRLVLLTSHGSEPFTQFEFEADDTLLFGRESAGAPDFVHDAADARLRIPLREGFRSLNIAVAVAMVTGEALRQTGGFPTR